VLITVRAINNGGDNLNNIIEKSITDTLTMESEALLEIRDGIDWETLENVVDVLMNCTRKIILSGCGTSGEAAKKIAHTLCCIECPLSVSRPSRSLGRNEKRRRCNSVFKRRADTGNQ